MLTITKKLAPKVEDEADEYNSDDNNFAILKLEADATGEQPQEPNTPASGLNTPAVSDVNLIHAIENLKKNDALKRIDRLQEVSEKTFFEIGGVLSVIQKRKWFDACATFDDWVSKNTMYKMSKARALIQIYEAVLAADLPWPAIKDIGWTKMRAIARVLTKDNAEQWLSFAKDHGKLEVIAAARKHLAETGDASASQASHVTKLAGLKNKLKSLDAVDLAETLVEVIGSLDEAVRHQVMQAISASVIT